MKYAILMKNNGHYVPLIDDEKAIIEFDSMDEVKDEFERTGCDEVVVAKLTKELSIRRVKIE